MLTLSAWEPTWSVPPFVPPAAAPPPAWDASVTALRSTAGSSTWLAAPPPGVAGLAGGLGARPQPNASGIIIRAIPNNATTGRRMDHLLVTETFVTLSTLSQWLPDERQ